MATYGVPRRINAVTIVMIACALAGGYWLWRFFPAYFDAWSIDHILKEGATACYAADRLDEPARTRTLHEIVDKAKTNIIKRVGIHDPELEVNLNINEHKALMSADYSVVITHPGLSNTTTLRFHREKDADIKFVKWE
jgi:hypothetical protein